MLCPMNFPGNFNISKIFFFAYSFALFYGRKVFKHIGNKFYPINKKKRKKILLSANCSLFKALKELGTTSESSSPSRIVVLFPFPILTALTYVPLELRSSTMMTSFSLNNLQCFPLISLELGKLTVQSLDFNYRSVWRKKYLFLPM